MTFCYVSPNRLRQQGHCMFLFYFMLFSLVWFSLVEEYGNMFKAEENYIILKETYFGSHVIHQKLKDHTK
jgi:hypothetical protein